MKDGGPAFPRVGEGFGNPRYDTPGMTLRDWFAGRVMTAMLNRADVFKDVHESEDEFLDGWAEKSYIAADALLKAREK